MEIEEGRGSGKGISTTDVINNIKTRIRKGLRSMR